MTVCKTCGQRKRRSLPQNAYLHQLVTTLSESIKSKDGEYHSAQWWKVMLKSEYLGFSEYRRPDGQVIQVLISTADLDVEKFNEFITKVEAFAASRGVYLT